MIPGNLQPILWSKDINKIDLQKDKNYVIHQVLAYGTWENLGWLFKTYSREEIKKVFVEKPAKDYVPASFNFIKDYVLDLPNENINAQNYVRTFSRHIG